VGHANERHLFRSIGLILEPILTIGTLCGPHCSSQLFACTKQSASNRMVCHAEHCSGLLHRVFPNVAEDNHRPQRRAQPSHLLGESQDGLLFCQGLFRIKSWTRQPVEHVPLVSTRHAPDGKLWSTAPLPDLLVHGTPGSEETCNSARRGRSGPPRLRAEH
jgi:hypothetical protein